MHEMIALVFRVSRSRVACSLENEPSRMKDSAGQARLDRASSGELGGLRARLPELPRYRRRRPARATKPLQPTAIKAEVQASHFQESQLRSIGQTTAAHRRATRLNHTGVHRSALSAKPAHHHSQAFRRHCNLKIRPLNGSNYTHKMRGLPL
jgi:hypothetical protein